MKITIEVVQLQEQRKFHGKYIIGDWYFDEITDDLILKVVDFGDWRYNYLYACHEMDEAFFCKAAGISTKVVDEWCDKPEDAPECGEGNPDSFSGYGEAPYQFQHNDALAIEWIRARLLGVDWREYGKAVQKYVDLGCTF